jgi:hypothetical protein
MSYIGSYARMLFGGTVGGDQPGRASGGSAHQNISESVVATTRRSIKGPQRNGHYSLHVKNAAGSAPVGNLTVWYSNLPNPDLTSDADWVQDTTVTSIDLSVVANTFVNVGNVNAEHVMVKVLRTSGTISLIVWARAEGVDN